MMASVSAVRKASRSFLQASLLLVLIGNPTKLWSRIPTPPWAIDLTWPEFASAPTVFRGSVIYIDRTEADRLSIAHFQVDRWYRDGGGVDAEVRFADYSVVSAINGHACIDFMPGSYWLVFAKEVGGHLELVHDCD